MEEAEARDWRSADLRDNPTVKAWIAERRKDALSKDKDCPRCGWPHNSYVMCGMGATFGEVKLGRRVYYIDTSNVRWMLDFVGKLGGDGWLHWRDEIYFRRTADAVEVMHLETYNPQHALPSEVIWKIPLNEWATITDQMATLPPVAAESK